MEIFGRKSENKEKEKEEEVEKDNFFNCSADCFNVPARKFVVENILPLLEGKSSDEILFIGNAIKDISRLVLRYHLKIRGSVVLEGPALLSYIDLTYYPGGAKDLPQHSPRPAPSDPVDVDKPSPD